MEVEGRGESIPTIGYNEPIIYDSTNYTYNGEPITAVVSAVNKDLKLIVELVK